MDRRVWALVAGAFFAGLTVQPTVAAALQEIRLEPGSSAVISAEARVSCAGSCAALDLPVCKVERYGTKSYKISGAAVSEIAESLDEVAALVGKMSAARICR